MTSELLAQSYDSDCQLTYYRQVLLDAKASSIEVQLDIHGKGKGLVATRDISEGDTVFVERPLVNLQHLDNHDSALVCEACLCFIGSIEEQIGHKLRCLVNSLRGVQRKSEGSDQDEDEDVDVDEALQAGERLEEIYAHVTPERISELCSGTVKLPLSDDFQLPRPVPCRRGCGALYCGTACEAAAWEHSHCLLCTGRPTEPAATDATDADDKNSAPPAADGPASSSPPAAEQCAGASSPPLASSAAGAGGSRSSDAGGPSSSSAAAAAAPAADEVEELYGIRVDRRALAAFWAHARETNEIFLLAAQVVAATLLGAARRLAGGSPERRRGEDEDAAGEDEVEVEDAAGSGAGQTASAGVAGAGVVGGAAAGPSGAAGGTSAGDASGYRAALLAAWRPYRFAWKRCWWESVAAPEDVDDEAEFRSQLRSLTSDSLELLSAALRDPRFGSEVLQLEVYGSIVGMFELNNMGLTVESPVEEYFLQVDELPEGREKQGVMQVTQPLLDALDTEYATPGEATAFLALQSCINHSCDPNCTAGCDDGDATVTVVAQRDIAAGEEITLSYIDVSLPYKDRQAELRDYGFVCRCARCVSEAAAARAKRQIKGVKVGSGRRR